MVFYRGAHGFTVAKNAWIEPFTSFTGAGDNNASGSNGVQINGVDPEREDATRGFKAMVKTGDYFDPAKRNQVLNGKKLAEKMKLAPGAKVVLTFKTASKRLCPGHLGGGLVRIAQCAAG